VENNEEILVTVYPNPTTDQLLVSTGGIFTYQVVALNGDLITNGLGFNKIELSLVDLEDGIYFLVIKTNEKTRTVKVVKK